MPKFCDTTIERMGRRIRDELMAGVKPEAFDSRFERVENMAKSGEIETMARKRIAQEQANYLKGKPEIIGSPAALYKDDPYRKAIVDRGLFNQVETEAKAAMRSHNTNNVRDAVAQSFKTRYPDMPEHLARGLGQTYATAMEIGDIERNTVLSRDPAIKPAGPTRPRIGHLARSLASAVTQHIPGEDPVHDLGDLRGEVRHVLSNGPSHAPRDPKKIEEAAREIARARHINEVKLEVIGKVLKDSGTPDTVNDYYVTRAVHRNENPFARISPKLSRMFDTDLQGRIEGMKPTDFRPDEADKAIARATAFLPSSYPDQGKHVAKAIVRAAAARALPEAEKIRSERKELINDLTNWNALGEDKQKAAVERLYSAFTHKEVEQLTDPKSAMSRSMPALPQQPKGFRAGLSALLQSDTSVSLPWAKRHDQLSKDISRGVDRDRGYEMD